MVNNKFMDFIPVLRKQYNREQSKIEPEEIVNIRNEISDLQEELDNDLA